MDTETKTRFIRALAEYLAGRQVEKSVRIQMSTKFRNDDVDAQEWARLRNLSPLRGYPTVDEAEKALTEWLLGSR